MSEVKQNYYVYYSGDCGNSFHERVKVLWDVETNDINEIRKLVGEYGIYLDNEVVIDKYDGTEFTINTVEIYKEKNNRQLCEGMNSNKFEADFLDWMGGEYSGEYDYEPIAEFYQESENQRADRIEQENAELKKENAELKNKITELEKEKNA